MPKLTVVSGTSGAGGSGEEIRLTIPALADYARIARLTVTGLASRLDLPYDDVEDMRIAVGEICSVLLSGDGGRLAFVCTMGPSGLAVEARKDPAAPTGPITDLTRQILEAVVDEASIDEDHGCITVFKRRR